MLTFFGQATVSVRNRQYGFTLVELVVTLVLVAALSAILLPRWQGPETTLTYQADRFARDLRHAQALAMNWQRVLRLNIDGDGYSVACASAGGPPCDSSPVVDPATGDSFSVTLTDATIAGGGVDLDGLGRPVSGGSLIAGAATWTLTGGSRSVTVTLQPLTGFVEAGY